MTKHFLLVLAMLGSCAHATQISTNGLADNAVTNPKIANGTINLTTKVTGALPIANGGTGQTTASAAFGSFMPLTNDFYISWEDTSNNPVNLLTLDSGDTFQVGTASTYPTNVRGNTISVSSTSNIALSSNTSEISLHGSGSTAADLRFKDADGSTYVGIKALDVLGATYSLTLPPNDGSSGQFLQTDGSGVLVWASAGGGSAAGATGAVQFNNAGAFAADDTNFFWDDTNNRLGILTNSPDYTVEISGTTLVSGFSGSPSPTTSGVYLLESSDNPSFLLSRATSTADQRMWDVAMTADGVFSFRAVNDAFSSATPWLTATGGYAGVASANFGVGTDMGLQGATSGTFSQAAAATTTSYTVTWPSAQGAASTFLQNDGSGNLAWVAGGGGGANTALSNLAAVAINTSLISDTDITDDLGTSAIAWNSLYVNRIFGNGATPSDIDFIGGDEFRVTTKAAGSSVITLRTSNAAAAGMSFDTNYDGVPVDTNTGAINFSTAAATGTGNSGGYEFDVGTVVNGTGGNIRLTPGLESGAGVNGKILLRGDSVLSNGFYLKGRDAGDTADVNLAIVDGTDTIRYGGAGEIEMDVAATYLAIASAEVGIAGENQVLIESDTGFIELQATTFNFLNSNELRLTKTITAGGTTTVQTINKVSGRINIAATETTKQVNNSTVSTTSLVIAVAQTDDATCYVKNVVPTSGQFVITMTAACTAETAVAFWVTN